MIIILAVDIGSSSVRCTAYTFSPPDTTINLHGACSKVLTPEFDENGQFDPQILRSSVEAAITNCLSKISTEDIIVAIGFDCFAMSFVGSGASGNAITKVFSYAERSESTVMYTDKLRRRLELGNLTEATHQRTGAPIHSAYAGPTLMRLLHEVPSLFDRVVCWQSFTSHLLQQWTAHTSIIPVSYSEASWTGLFHRTNKCWDSELLSIIGMDDDMCSKLAPVADYDALPESLRLSPAMLDLWPKLSNARIFLGFGDGAMANVGSKCTDASRVAVTVGTSAALRVVIPSDRVEVVPPGLWCYAVDGELSLLGGALTDGGTIHAFLNKILKEGVEEQEQEQEQEQEERAVGCHGLVVLPFLGGERSPGWRDNAQGTIHGMTRGTTSRDIQQAMYESVCLRLRSIMKLVSSYVEDEAIVLASGTALKSNPVWKQMMADALGKPLMVEETSEDTSRGVTLMVVKSLLKKNMLVKEKLDMNIQIWTSTKSEAYGHELKKQEELYRRLYKEERSAESWLVGGHVVGASVVCGMVLGYALSYLRRKY